MDRIIDIASVVTLKSVQSPKPIGSAQVSPLALSSGSSLAATPLKFRHSISNSSIIGQRWRSQEFSGKIIDNIELFLQGSQRLCKSGSNRWLTSKNSGLEGIRELPRVKGLLASFAGKEHLDKQSIEELVQCLGIVASVATLRGEDWLQMEILSYCPLLSAISELRHVMVRTVDQWSQTEMWTHVVTKIDRPIQVMPITRDICTQTDIPVLKVDASTETKQKKRVCCVLM